jgi:predicted NBD/HSP70 family sugar kinase
MSRAEKLVLIVAVESVGAWNFAYRGSTEGLQTIPLENDRWDCTPYFDDPSGLRLVEEIIRRCRTLIRSLGHQPDAIGLTMPGTIGGATTVERSTRLGILEPVDIAKIFAERGVPTCYILHDTECMALGEARHGALRDAPHIIPGRENFAFIFADEGIGATQYIDGKVYRGAGNAGRIGRLVVLPEGPYNRRMMARGPLELFAARPSVSTNIVGELLAEKGKAGEAVTGDRVFRAAISTAAKGDWSSLTLQQIARGINSKDPVAVTIIEEAARYLGLAVHAIVTIAHPPAIILGGGMITELPGFSQSVISHARRFSYDVAWNRTTIRQATLGRTGQALGAVDQTFRLTSAKE